MQAIVRATGGILGHAGAQILSNNIEAYENTIPSMLSDRLRNGKFTGPENPQTGIAAEWEPAGNTMAGFSCRLVPGMYPVSYTHLRAHETRHDLVCRLLLEKKKTKN